MSAPKNNRLRYQVQTFIDSEDDRSKLYSALQCYQSDQDIKVFVSSLKRILNRPERLRMYDLLRPCVIAQHQMDYNMLVPYVSNRQRTVQLSRRTSPSSPYGFSIRGGCEHGIGVYVSEVVDSSIAFNKGLKVGDQIVRINGLSIEEAVHEEVLNLIARSKTSLLLKVKSVGMIPVQSFDDDNEYPNEDKSFVDELPVASPLSSPRNEDDVFPVIRRRVSVVSTTSSISSRRSDALSWILSDDTKRMTPTSQLDEKTEVKIFIDVSKTQKFGCSICKGPAEKAGVYVQSVAAGGLAEQVGLQTGDHILLANGRNLNAMPFHEAVQYLKSCKRAELLVRKGAAVELFPVSPMAVDAYSEETKRLNGGEDSASSVSSAHSREAPEGSATVTSQVQMVSKVGPRRLTIVETEEQRARTESEEKEERWRQVNYALKLEAIKQQEEVKDLIHSSKFTKAESEPQSLISAAEMKRLEDIHLASIVERNLSEDENVSSSESSLSDVEVEEKAIPKRKIAVANMYSSSSAAAKRGQGKSLLAIETIASADSEGPKGNEEKAERSNVMIKRKPVSFADALFDKESDDDERDRKSSSSSFNDLRRQSIVMAVKPTPHMFVDPLPKLEDSENAEIRVKPLLFPAGDGIFNRKLSSITDSLPAPAKPPEFFFPKRRVETDPKAKVSVGSYAFLPPAQRMAYFQPKVIKIESKPNITNNGTSNNSNGRVMLNGRGSEAKPLFETQLSLLSKKPSAEVVASQQQQRKTDDADSERVSSFNAARAKFMREEMQKAAPMMNLKKASVVNSTSSDGFRENKSRQSVVQNGHKISIKTPSDQIVIVKKNN